MKNFDKIMSLVKTTGDRFVVEDAQGEVFVVMDFKSYEKLVKAFSPTQGLSKNELVEKINRDINIWKSDHEDEDLDEFLPDFEADDYDFEDEMPDDLPPEIDYNGKIIPPENKNELKLTKDQNEEDKYYFEPQEDAF